LTRNIPSTKGKELSFINSNKYFNVLLEKVKEKERREGRKKE
jgi:hypothetical protein